MVRPLIYAFVWMICLVSSTACLAAQEDKVIRISNGEWPPYLGQALPSYGLASQIITEAFALPGVKVEYCFFPWSRLLALVKAGDIDAIVIRLSTDERQRDFWFSDPVIDSRYVFSHLKSFQFKWNTLDDLKEIAIGGTNNYHYGEKYLAAARSGKIAVLWAGTDEINFRNLFNKNIQIFPQDEIVGRYILASLFTSDEVNKFTWDTHALKQDHLYLLFSKNNQKNKIFISLRNAGLKNLKDSGKYEKIL